VRKKSHRNASALGHEVLDGLDRGTDTGVVGDGLAVKGHVKVAAHENLIKYSQFSGVSQKNHHTFRTIKSHDIWHGQHAKQKQQRCALMMCKESTSASQMRVLDPTPSIEESRLTFLPLSSASFMSPTDFLAMVREVAALIWAAREVGARREGEKVEERATCVFCGCAWKY